VAVSVRLGNHAAFATPTRVCAASSEFCAADTSGLRLSTVLGTPAGITGSAVFHSATPSVKLDDTSPISTASACSSSARRRSSASASDSVAATSVRARATSSSATSPARKRRSVSESVSRYALTVLRTRLSRVERP